MSTENAQTPTNAFDSFLAAPTTQEGVPVVPVPTAATVPATDATAEEQPSPTEGETKTDAAPDDTPKTVTDEPTGKRYAYLLKKQHKTATENGKLKAQNDALYAELATIKSELQQVKTSLNPGTTEAESTPESQQAMAEMAAKVKAATALAYQQYGRDQIDALIFQEDGPWRTFEKTHPWAFVRATSADNPIQEALTILEEQATLDQWGRNPEAVLKKADAVLRPKISQEFAKQAAGLGVQPGKIPPGLSGVRGTGEKPSTVPDGQSAFDLATLSVVT